MSKEDEDELYNDIFASALEKVVPEVIENLKQEIEQLRVEKNDLCKSIENLLSVNSAIKKENQTLKTNISSLFKTAQNEIKRKTKMIDQLRLDSMKARPDNQSEPVRQISSAGIQSSSNQNKYNSEYYRDNRNTREIQSDSSQASYHSDRSFDSRSVRCSLDHSRQSDRSRLNDTQVRNNCQKLSSNQNVNRVESPNRNNEKKQAISDQPSSVSSHHVSTHPTTPFSLSSKPAPPLPKVCVPKPPGPLERIKVQGPRNVFNRRLGLRLNNESKKLHQQAVEKYKASLCSPYDKKSSPELKPNTNLQTKELLMNAKENRVASTNPAIPQINQSIPRSNPTPCVSLIDKIKEIEQVVNLNKSDKNIVSEILKSPTIVKKKRHETLTVKMPSPPLPVRRENPKSHKNNESIKPVGETCPKETVQSKIISACKNIGASRQFSIFEPEVQLHCESSCDSNFGEIFGSKPIAGLVAKPGRKTPCTVKPTSQLSKKSSNLSVTPNKSDRSTIDLIPVYNLKSPERFKTLSMSNTSMKTGSTKNRTCLKLGEVSIKVTSPGMKVPTPVKHLPEKASITKIPMADSNSPEKNQNNQNEANCDRLAPDLDEDSQDIVVPARKRKFVIIDSDDEVSLPPIKKMVLKSEEDHNVNRMQKKDNSKKISYSVANSDVVMFSESKNSGAEISTDELHIAPAVENILTSPTPDLVTRKETTALPVDQEHISIDPTSNKTNDANSTPVKTVDIEGVKDKASESPQDSGSHWNSSAELANTRCESTPRTKTFSRKENKFSVLSRRRIVRLGRAVIKTITMKTPEKNEIIQVNVTPDRKENDGVIKTDDVGMKSEEELCNPVDTVSDSTKKSLDSCPGSDSFKNNPIRPIARVLRVSTVASIVETKPKVDESSELLVPPDNNTSNAQVLNDKQLKILKEIIDENPKLTESTLCTGSVNESTAESSDSPQKTVLSSAKMNEKEDIEHTKTKAAVVQKMRRVSQYEIQQIENQIPESIGQVDEGTLDANDIVGRVMRDGTKPILNLNVSVTSEPCYDNLSDVESNKNSTPQKDRESKEMTKSSSTPVLGVHTKVLQVESPRNFDELNIASDLIWKERNASLKHESFNYSGKKPKKRVSHYIKPNSSKSPGKSSPGSSANMLVTSKRTPDKMKLVKTKSPLKKELSQAITTSYKVASFRDIISTQPVQKNEKINVLTPRKSPNNASILKKEEKNEIIVQKSSVGSQKKQKQSMLHRDIEMKLKAIDVKGENKNGHVQTTPLGNKSINISPVTAGLSKLTNQTHNTMEDSRTEKSKPHFLIPGLLEENARFVSITSRTSTITSSCTSTMLQAAPDQSKRCTSFESNSSSGFSVFNSISDIQFRNEHTISPFQDAFKLMNETPFKQLMTGTFSCVSPMPETPYKADETPSKKTPETSQDKPEQCDNATVHIELKTPMKPVNTSSCSSSAMQTLHDELALTPDGTSENSDFGENRVNTNDLRCHVDSIQRDLTTRPDMAQGNGILAISSTQLVYNTSKESEEKSKEQHNAKSTHVHINSTGDGEIAQACESHISQSKSLKCNQDVKIYNSTPVKSPIVFISPDNTKKADSKISFPSEKMPRVPPITSPSTFSKNENSPAFRKGNESTTGTVRQSRFDIPAPHLDAEKLILKSPSKSEGRCENISKTERKDSSENSNEISERRDRSVSPRKCRFTDNKEHNSSHESRQCKYSERSPDNSNRKRRRSPSPRYRDRSRHSPGRKCKERSPSPDQRHRKRQSSPYRKYNQTTASRNERSRETNRSPNRKHQRRDSSRNEKPRHRDKSRRREDYSEKHTRQRDKSNDRLRKDKTSPQRSKYREKSKERSKDRSKKYKTSPQRSKYREKSEERSEDRSRNYKTSPQRSKYREKSEEKSEDRSRNYKTSPQRSKYREKSEEKSEDRSRNYKTSPQRSKYRGKSEEKSEDRSRNYKTSPQRSKYREKSEEKSEDRSRNYKTSPQRSKYRENSEERSRRHREKGSGQIAKTPMKKVIVKEILYYTQSSIQSSPSEDERENYRQRQKQKSPSPSKEYRSKEKDLTNDSRRIDEHSSTSRRQSTAENNISGEGNRSRCKHEPNPSDVNTRDNLEDSESRMESKETVALEASSESSNHIDSSTNHNPVASGRPVHSEVEEGLCSSSSNESPVQCQS